VLSIDPNNTGALVNKGTALGQLGRYEEAFSLLNSAISINPNSADALTVRAIMFHQIANDENARRDIAKVLEIDPSNAYARSMGMKLGINVTPVQ
jgi:Flp pilus assembly protein TadD